MAMIVKSACCCFGLRVGCLIIGYLGAVFFTLATISNFVLFCSCFYFVLNPEAFKEWKRENRISDDSADSLGTVVGLSLSIILLVINAMCLGFHIALLVGVHQKRVNHVKNWTIFQMVCIVLIALLLIVYMVDHPNYKNFLVGFIIFGLNLYFWAVVRSYYNYLKNGNDGSYSAI